MYFSKSQHGEEAFPPGVPAPRLSIVAATQALPNVIGNRLQNGQATTQQQQQQQQPNQAQVAMQAAAAAFMMSNSLNSSNSDTSPESAAKRLKTESDEHEATIEEW